MAKKKNDLDAAETVEPQAEVAVIAAEPEPPAAPAFGPKERYLAAHAELAEAEQAFIAAKTRFEAATLQAHLVERFAEFNK